MAHSDEGFADFCGMGIAPVDPEAIRQSEENSAREKAEWESLTVCQEDDLRLVGEGPSFVSEGWYFTVSHAVATRKGKVDECGVPLSLPRYSADGKGIQIAPGAGVIPWLEG